ncbi:MAG: MerR family transcriptional regulator [Ignavibacteriales bacterium]|nr:MerR family transcriptional regulator [Ignavibacteriales bacterium]
MEKTSNTISRTSDQQHDPVYSIGTVARMLKVSVHLLRLYEREGLILPIRSEGRQRLYSASDVSRLGCIISAIRDQKMSIASIQKIQSLIPCWKIRNCREKDRIVCAAFSTAGKACWMIKSDVLACGMQSCRECVVYLRSGDCSSIKQFIIDATSPELRQQ